MYVSGHIAPGLSSWYKIQEIEENHADTKKSGLQKHAHAIAGLVDARRPPSASRSPHEASPLPGRNHPHVSEGGLRPLGDIGSEPVRVMPPRTFLCLRSDRTLTRIRHNLESQAASQDGKALASRGPYGASAFLGLQTGLHQACTEGDGAPTDKRGGTILGLEPDETLSTPPKRCFGAV